MGPGDEQSMFHSVITRMTRPISGTASNVTSSQAADRSQPPSGRVKAIRQVT